MASPKATALASEKMGEWPLTRVAAFSRMRVLAWDEDVLYASQAYTLLRARIDPDTLVSTSQRGPGCDLRWEIVGYFRPAWWRNLTVTAKLTFRLFRDGFHALALLPSRHAVAAVPGAIITLAPGETEFRVSHEILRGTRPLHIAVTPEQRLFWGEYFDNAQRDEVHVYASEDRGLTWDVAYTFPKGEIRHVHNIIYDQWANCLWILTGDDGAECRVLRATCDFSRVDVVISGNQQARAVALVANQDALYFASDTPLEANHVYRLDRGGDLTKVASLASSSTYGCCVGDTIFFSTMVEPSAVNPIRSVGLYASRGGTRWGRVLEWKKDGWPMAFFQYGNAFLPDGKNTSGLLAVTSVAVENGDLETTVWRV